MPAEARLNRHIACEELNHVWDKPQLDELKRLWDEDYSIQQLAKYFYREREEIVIALLDILNDTQKLDLFGRRWGVRAYKKPSKFVCMD